VNAARRSYVLVRLWSVAIVGLASGVLGDGWTEFLNAAYLLARHNIDNSQEGLLPASFLAVLLAIGLAIYVAGARIGPADPLLRELDDLRARIIDGFAAFAVSWLTVICIEGYETRFGGTAPFDAGSTVLTHAPALLASFLTIAFAARALMGVAIRWAARKGAAAVALLTSFLRKLRVRVVAPRHATIVSDAVFRHECPELAGLIGPRAPPLHATHVL
jgi:hypothetical protein